MQRTPVRWWLAATVVIAFQAVQAQQPVNPAAAPDPLDARAAVPPLVYRSTLSGQRPIDADKPVPWREANDNVGRIGGWRAYAREAAATEATQARPNPVSAPAEPPAPAAHGGHKH